MSVIDLRELSGKVGAHVPGGPSEAEPGGVHAGAAPRSGGALI